MTIGQRLKEERERLGFTQPSFAELASTTKKSQIDYEKDLTQPKANYLASIAEAGADVNYIITGKRINKSQNCDLDNGYDGFSVVPVFADVMISAGHGSMVEDHCEPTSYMAFRNDWIRDRGFLLKDLCVYIARGDSMSPTIDDKEPILTHRSEDDKIPQDGHIYVIRNGENHWVKRIQKQLDNTLLLISDNKTYPPMRLDLETAHDVEILGKVVNSSKNFY
ncbi:XRE family transcriptional regulator [Acinetobacter wuhouensis]|uniref:Peptidase S24 n=1 Tax=Acinetobacter wuhouensis TaxID=1879050 RepID=A0A3G2T3X4_9GAMM|nr:S24 family peptidase [Acinetobacter wuhouensis]AYO54934.1 peptidase S24 [Acinetobacter wuhouensis]